MSQVIHQIGLRGYEVVGFDDSLKPALLRVEPSTRPTHCLCCGADRLHSKGRYQRRVRHLEAFGRPVLLRIQCRRYRCLRCAKSFVQPLPGIVSGRQSSEPYRQRIYQQHRDGISGRVLAHCARLGSATVERIYHQFTQRKAAERESLVCPTVLGIDEHSVHTGQRFATTFCNLRTHCVFDVVEGRRTEDLEAFLMRLKGRDAVKVVCIDLSSSYRYLIRRYFPKAKIVADRFHVVRMVQHHFMELFRALEPEIKYERGSLAALRTKPVNLTEKRRFKLRQLFAQNPALEPIYEQMQKVLRLLRRKTQTARQCRRLAPQLLRIMEELKSSRFRAMKTLAQTLRSWQEEIACMWRFSKNNGITEGFHRKMKLIQRRAYGFRNFNNYRLRVIAECG